jgi:hypothetical protein
MMMRSMNMKVGMSSRPMVAARPVLVRSSEQPGVPTPTPAPEATPAQTSTSAPTPPSPSLAMPRNGSQFASVGEIMNFNGSAPEIVNGRLAMLGFVAAAGAEFASGQPILSQFVMEPTGINLVFALFMMGSLVPLFFKLKAKAVGPFTPSAELLNGRAAMLGFTALLVTEHLTGFTFFSP